MPNRYSTLTKKSTREWVYFLGSESPKNLIKIGRAANLERRLAGLQAMSSVRVFLMAAFNAPRRTEALFHCLFEEHREHGEWFRPGNSLLSFLEHERPQMLVLSDLAKICAELGKQVDLSKVMSEPIRDEAVSEFEEMESRFHDAAPSAKYDVPVSLLRPIGRL
jgi:T5orf172 domain-containing protein